MSSEFDSDYDSESELDSIPVLLNGAYGGFCLSETAKAKVQLLFDKKNKGEFNEYGSKNQRHDTDLLSVVFKLGLTKSSARYCELYIKYIPTEFINSYNITEYDGAETLKLDYTKYLMTKLDSIMENEKLTSDEKIEEVNKVRSFVKGIQENYS